MRFRQPSTGSSSPHGQAGQGLRLQRTLVRLDETETRIRKSRRIRKVGKVVSLRRARARQVSGLPKGYSPRRSDGRHSYARLRDQRSGRLGYESVTQKSSPRSVLSAPQPLQQGELSFTSSSDLSRQSQPKGISILLLQTSQEAHDHLCNSSGQGEVQSCAYTYKVLSK